MNKGVKIGIGLGIFVVGFLLASLFAYLTVGKSQEIETNETVKTTEDIELDSPTLHPEKEPEIQETKEDPFAEMKNFALEKINEDRKISGLDLVKLSDNIAAQVHAEEILQTRDISHWTTSGKKPYMAYTLLGGKGYISQNIAFRGIADIEQCNQINVICEPIFPFTAIRNSQYKMVYDDAAANWGHRDNILDPHHSHVSLGIAYDDYSFAYVQNFENNYLEFSEPIAENQKIRITGILQKGKIFNIGIYRDNLPSALEYEKHKNDSSYGMGKYVAMIKEPAPENSFYVQPPSYKLIEANIWNQQEKSIEIEFDLSDVINQNGVYTVVLWVSHNNEEFPVTSHSIFVQ